MKEIVVTISREVTGEVNLLVPDDFDEKSLFCPDTFYRTVSQAIKVRVKSSGFDDWDDQWEPTDIALDLARVANEEDKGYENYNMVEEIEKIRKETCGESK